MKQLACMLLAAVMLLTLFTGCSSSQTGETLPGLTPATGTEWTAQPEPEKDYEIPARFIGEWTGVEDTFTVKADAEILLPEDMSKLCTAKVTRHGFTQEQADKVMEAFLKGEPLYEYVTLTKEKCQECIDYFEACLRGEIRYEGDGTLERLPEVIAWYKGNMETAPHEDAIPLANTQFHPEVLPYGATSSGRDPNYEEITGCAEVEGRKLIFRFENSGGDGYDYMNVFEEAYALNGPHLTEVSRRNIENWSMTFPRDEQALAVGDSLMAALGLDDFTCDRMVPVQFGEELPETEPNQNACYEANPEDGFLLEYVRRVNGLPLTETDFNGDSWAYEQVRIYVLGDRVVDFRWVSPYEVTKVQPCEKLMDFQEIQEVFAKMIFVKNDYYRDINNKNGFPTFMDLKIDKVQLTLMRVHPKDSVQEGTIIPVWDFWGTETAKWDQGTGEMTGEPRYGVLCTINAIDGTLVDREIGY